MKIIVLSIAVGILTFAGAVSAMFQLGFNKSQVIGSQVLFVAVATIFVIAYKKKYLK